MPDFPSKQRQKLADKGQAMPQGGFPIRNRADLKRAIQAIGRAKNPDSAKAWIKKRAKELNAEDLLPESWSVTHSQKPSLDEDLLEHFGIKGMHWGVRRNNGNSSGGSHEKLKRNAKIAGGAALAIGGAAATAYLLSKHGSIPMHSVPKNHHAEAAVKAFDENVWRTQLNTIMTGTQLQAAYRVRARAARGPR